MGASSSSGFCRTGRGGGNPQITERLVCWHEYPQGLSVTHPRPGPLRGEPAASPPPGAAAGPRTPGIRHGGEVCFASGVQAEARGSEGCRGVLRPSLTCEECCESRGKHPHAASPSPCLPAGGTACWGTAARGFESCTVGFGVSRGCAVPRDTPVTAHRGAQGRWGTHPGREPSRDTGAAEVAVTPASGHRMGRAGQAQSPAPGRPDMNSASPSRER